ncbi:hypothetical protein IMCC3135_01035 [Granulosicoccus antarcticus IMCC3135]|uniref:Uncharacterized protein n=1 Tax=Granulosicoccus antarcticus IMCC3135 TaxID=1192854 RepID=A0A2Z2NJT0_9GAMM|nr:hypothetical protein IMCC3135_01035 [Granulosicoccus antarcticus IMCC3135]
MFVAHFSLVNNAYNKSKFLLPISSKYKIMANLRRNNKSNYKDKGPPAYFMHVKN